MPFDTPPPPPPVEQVIVTAARLPPAAAEAAFSTVHLGERDLAKSPAGRRGREPDAGRLAVSPHLQPVGQSDHPGHQPAGHRPVGRGADPGHPGRRAAERPVRRLGDLVATGAGVPDRDRHRARGGGGALRSRRPDRGHRPEGARRGIAADVSVGELGSQRASAAAVSTLGRFEFFGAASYDKSDGYVPVRGPARGAADTKTDLEAKSISGRVDMATGLGLLSLRGGFFEEDRGAGLAGARANASGNVFSATLVQAPRGEALGWKLQAWRRTSDLFNSSVAVAADRSGTTPGQQPGQDPRHRLGPERRPAPQGRRAGMGAGRRRPPERRRGARALQLFGRDLHAQPRGGRQDLGGRGLCRRLVDDRPVAGGRRPAAGPLGKHRRLPRRAQRPDRAVLLDQRPADRDGEVVSGRLGVTRKIGDGATARVAGYTGFRPASLNELYRPFRVGNDVTEANAGLKPERLQGLEAGVSRKGAKGLIEATAFWNRIEDPIVNVTLGAGPGTFPIGGFIPAGGVLRQRQNAGTIDAVGLEGRGRTQDRRRDPDLGPVGHRRPAGRRLDAPQLTGKRPAQAPIWSATAGLSADLTETLTLATDLTWEGKRFEDDLNSRVLDPAYRLDARLDWRVKPLVTVYVAGDNLLDANIQTSRTADGVAGMRRRGLCGWG
jgi:hypothetical protein